RTTGKVHELADLLNLNYLPGNIGIAHTRWATHGKPSEINAHPHISNGTIAIVHNGIIENHGVLKDQLVQVGYTFASETDTEVAAHLIHRHYMQNNRNLLAAVQLAVKEFRGAYALGIMQKNDPDHLIAVRSGCPLVIGIGIKERFFASDPLA